MRRYRFFRKMGCSVFASAFMVGINSLSNLDEDHAGFMMYVWDMREFGL